MAGWRNISTIIEGRLYLGSIEAAKSPRTLTERRITHILSIGTEPIPPENPASGIKHYRIPVEDVPQTDLLINFPAACNFIHQAISMGGVVLVHSTRGISRGPTVVAAYLMWSRRIEAAAAMDEVRRARDQVWFSGSFHEQLVIFPICRYQPGPHDGVYNNWRHTLMRAMR